ncbi:hypothetical protein [Geobacter sp. DSM 9736]|uniref:hypothetical protein n=1 Tax=Geobacter sp. DSM 9736 TaxID=1277350 RepID=UPI000B513BBE|nr:hypothetical protein [Geobacter sp. DSM 9736]SNB46586.1 hypothetical protein SAMN06269301_2054 [Geobacter sp. DSM 9736]
MESLSALMLVIIALFLSVTVPRLYGDWISWQAHMREGDLEQARRVMAAENLWVQRHFWCAAAAIAMAVLLDSGAPDAAAHRLAHITKVYAGISLVLALIESLFAHKVSAALAVAQDGKRSSEMG